MASNIISMDPVEELDLQGVCRTCLCEIDDENFVHITDIEDVHQRSFTDLIYDCLRQKVNQDDDFSKVICDGCALELRRFYSFRIRCQHSYETMERMVPAKKVNKGITAVKVEFAEVPLPPTDKCIQTEPVHPCEICKETFSSYSEMRTHRAKHKAEGYKCTLCDKSYTRLSYLKGHIGVHHPEEAQLQISYTKKCCCPLCYKQYTRPDHMQTHLMRHVQEMEWQSTRLITKSEVEDDNEYQSIDNESDQTEVEDQVKTQAFLEHVEFDDSRCEDNAAISENEATADVDIENFEEDVTEHEVNTAKDTENVHSRIVLVEDKYPRLIKCARGRPRNNSNGKQKEHRCNICNKTFKRSTHLTRHYHVHIDYKAFKCKICDKGFVRSDHLQLHMFNHSDEKPFNCERCGKGFIRPENYRKHMKRETCEPVIQPKLFNCKYCQKGFSTERYLKVHTARHEALQCVNCNKVMPNFNAKMLHEPDCPGEGYERDEFSEAEGESSMAEVQSQNSNEGFYEIDTFETFESADNECDDVFNGAEFICEDDTSDMLQ